MTAVADGENILCIEVIDEDAAVVLVNGVGRGKRVIEMVDAHLEVREGDVNVIVALDIVSERAQVEGDTGS